MLWASILTASSVLPLIEGGARVECGDILVCIHKVTPQTMGVGETCCFTDHTVVYFPVWSFTDYMLILVYVRLFNTRP